MTKIWDDTPREIEAMLVKRYRKMPAWKKLEQVKELTQSAFGIALAGLAEQHPDDTEQELMLKLVSRWLDKKTVKKLAAMAAGK